MTNSKKTKRYQFWINLILIVMTLTIILPFLLVFISSITDETVLIRNGYSFFPEKISFYAYQYIIRQGEKILRAYGVTILITVVGTFFNLMFSALLAYPLSVKTLPYRRPVSYTHLRAHETDSYLVCRLLLEKKNLSLIHLS